MNESFLQRWARRKAEYKNADLGPEEQHAAAPASDSHSAEFAPEIDAAPLPTLDDVARLTRESDYSRFLSKGIDKAVRRAALKKLFSDPHFKLMDGLDIYMDDYNKPSPVSPAMLAALKHTQSMFETIAQREAEQAEPQPVPGLERDDEKVERRAAAGERATDSAQPDERGGDEVEEAEEAGCQAAQDAEHRDKDDGMQAAQGRD